jgi:hypothetical protein
MTAIKKAVILCPLVACVLVSTMAGDAAAARKQVATTATLESVSADGVSGRVSTPQAACRRQRTVTVYMRNSDSPTTAVLFGSTTTAGDGSWSVGRWAYPGEYYAVVAARAPRHFACVTATSNSVTWWTSGAAS